MRVVRAVRDFFKGINLPLWAQREPDVCKLAREIKKRRPVKPYGLKTRDYSSPEILDDDVPLPDCCAASIGGPSETLERSKLRISKEANNG